MNKQLIEKWKAGEVAIINSYTPNYNKLFKELDIDIYPRIYGKYIFKKNGIAYVDNTLPEGMTAVPLSQFFEEGKQPTNKMKPYIDYLAEELTHHYENPVLADEIEPTLEITVTQSKAAADKFAEDRMVAFGLFLNNYDSHGDDYWEDNERGYTTSELIAIFNSETK